MAKKIYLDPGHGGSGAGAVNGARYEKTDALNLCLLIAKEFEGQDVEVMLSRTDNEKAQSYIQEALDAASTAVTYTCQTYVDALKDSETFTKENQLTAFKKAQQKALELLSASAIEFLKQEYGSAYGYLETQIEEEIHLQKSDTIMLPAAAIEVGAVTVDVEE